MDGPSLRVILGLACLWLMALAAPDAAAAAAANPPADAHAGARFDALASRYGVGGDEQTGDEPRLRAQIVELEAALPADDAVRSARLDAYRCLTLVEGPDESLARAERGLAEWPTGRDPLVRMEFLMCKAYAKYTAGDRTEYVAVLDDVLGLADAGQYPRLRAGALQLRSFHEHDQGRDAQVLGTLREVLALNRRSEAPMAAQRTEVMIALTYLDLGLTERTIEVLVPLEKAARAAGDTGLLGSVLGFLGRAEAQAGRPDAALAKYLEAEALERAAGTFDTHASVMLRIAQVHALAGRLDDARSARRQAEESLFRAQATGAMRARRGYLDALIALESGDPGRAALLLPDVLQRLRDDDQPRPLIDALDVQARAYRALGQWRAALDARDEQLRLRTELEQRIQREQARVLSAELALGRETAEKLRLQQEADAQQRQLEAARREQQLRLVAIALLALLLVASAGLLFLTRRRLRGARHDAMTDSLTGISSRRHLLDQLSRMLSDRRAAASPTSVLAIDIDHFKSINDRHGHAAGDAVLRRVTAACRHALRDSDAFGRLGGEEFLAVLPRSSLAAAAPLGERLRAAVAATVLDDVAAGLRVTISVGAAKAPAGDPDVDGLLTRADAALYRAKGDGRNCVRSAP